jgi:hypothetical protein
MRSPLKAAACCSERRLLLRLLLCCWQGWQLLPGQILWLLLLVAVITVPTAGLLLLHSAGSLSCRLVTACCQQGSYARN